MNTTGTDLKPLAVVTGASSGIGLALAKQFSKNGFDVFVTAERGIADVESELKALGAGVTALTVDLTTYDGVESLWSAVEAMGRPIAAVAINAGVGVGGDFRETDLDAELKLIDLNAKSTVHLAKRVVTAMTAQGHGRILFTSSIAASMPDPYEAVYGASKAFVYAFAEALRNELKDAGITVTALQPGPTETNFFHRAGMDDTKAGADKKDDAGLVAQQGFEALMAGKDHIVAGSVKTRLQEAVLSKLPEQLKAEAHRGLAEPGSAKT